MSKDVVAWLLTPSVTDWLNVLVVFALLIVTRKYARSTDRILLANQNLLEATRGILAETARQAEAATTATGVALAQWQQTRHDVLISILTAIHDSIGYTTELASRLRRALESGADDEDLNKAFRLPSTLLFSIERARYVSAGLHSQLSRAREHFDDACRTLADSSGEEDFGRLRKSFSLLENSRGDLEQAVVLLEVLVRDLARTSELVIPHSSG